MTLLVRYKLPVGSPHHSQLIPGWFQSFQRPRLMRKIKGANGALPFLTNKWNGKLEVSHWRREKREWFPLTPQRFQQVGAPIEQGC